MDVKEAKERLSYHSGRNSDIQNPKWKSGFLGSLRPFQGQLREENFHDIMECLKVLTDELSEPMIDREAVSDLVAIVHLARVWASPGGMLGSNHLLTKEQTNRLLAWCDIIETCFMYLLDDAEEEAFFEYEEYLDGSYF